MRRWIGFTLFLVSVASLLFFAWIRFDLAYWVLPPEAKFLRSWEADVKLLEQTGRLPKQWKEIKDISIRTDNSPAQYWTDKIRPPIATNPSGQMKLEVFIVHWIENTRYGAMVQYSLVDQSTNNTIWELGRTFKLGFVY